MAKDDKDKTLKDWITEITEIKDEPVSLYNLFQQIKEEDIEPPKLMSLILPTHEGTHTRH